MWAITCAVGGAASVWAVPLVFERKVAGSLLPVQILVTSAVIALPVLVSLYLFMGAFGSWIPIPLLPMQYLYVYAVTLVLTAIGVLLHRARNPERPAGEPDA
ncbi:MAG: hypothetical protein KC620_23435, partial [Myxococcales bacterium]|nr:hypothetical protein [Myxococcales bacterium]